MNRYLVIHEYTCPVCKGECHLYNEEWHGANHAYDVARAAYLKEHTSKTDHAQTEDQYYAQQSAAHEAGWRAMSGYWADRGYHGQLTWPSEDEPCGECMGHGIIRSKVDLAVALQAINELAEV